MIKPVRIQRKRSKGWRMPENTVYVGRGSRWGNPIKVCKTIPAAMAVELYISLVAPYSHHGLRCTVYDFMLSAVFIEDTRDLLRGKNLACWCKLDEPCHADYLLKIANEVGQ